MIRQCKCCETRRCLRLYDPMIDHSTRGLLGRICQPYFPFSTTDHRLRAAGVGGGGCLFSLFSFLFFDIRDFLFF